MFDNAKYVVFKLAGDDTEHFIMVDPTQTHSQAVRSLAFGIVDQQAWRELEHPFEPMSAGFVSIGPDRERQAKFSTYGKSVSLQKSHAGYLAKDADADTLAASHADQGLLYTIFDNGMSFAITVLGPTFSAEQAKKAFGNYTIYSQGRVKVAFNDEYEMEIQSIEHLMTPKAEWIEKELPELLRFLS